MGALPPIFGTTKSPGLNLKYLGKPKKKTSIFSAIQKVLESMMFSYAINYHVFKEKKESNGFSLCLLVFIATISKCSPK
ncbi:MAG: hypothetical protein FJZ57_04180 [Chlamydiae bacterium]|nr:hypothetical protein [Chlamydiota bacterium]